MIRRSGGLIALAMVALVSCGNSDQPSGVQANDAAAVMVATDSDTRVAEVSMTIRSAGKDELTGASVDPAFAKSVTLAAYAGSSGGDGHLGHLDPGSTHTHGGRLAIDLPAGQDVKIGPGGVAQIRVREIASTPDSGDVFNLTLKFEKTSSIVVPVAVAR